MLAFLAPYPMITALAVAGVATLSTTPTAAAGQWDAESRQATVLLAASLSSPSHPVHLRFADRTGDSERTIAHSLRRQAARLYADLERWDDVAVYHAHAALSSGFEGRAAVTDLVMAGNLFWRQGERRLACASLRQASRVAMSQGDLGGAAHALRSAVGLGSPECARHFEEMLEGRIVAAPAVVRVEAPELEIVTVEEVEIRPVLRRPELPRPPLGTLAVRIPPAPAPIRVEPPTIELPDLQEVKIAPELRLPDSAERMARVDRKSPWTP